jgi:hypothetical protein
MLPTACILALSDACTPPNVVGDPLTATSPASAFASPRCGAAATTTGEADLMGWDSRSRANLNRLRAQGVVAVRYSATNCDFQLELLPECIAPGSYTYAPYSANETKVSKNSGDLFAQMPLGAVRLAGKLQGNRALRTDDMLVGTASLAVAARRFTRADLKGPSCERATHVISTLYLGGFAMSAGEARHLEATGSWFGVAQTGADSDASVERVDTEGDAAACRRSLASGHEESLCNVPLRVGLAPIDAIDPAGQCDPTELWDGKECHDAVPADPDVWNVPVGASPAVGPSSALVTVVVFAGVLDPVTTWLDRGLSALRSMYPDELRIVYKYNDDFSGVGSEKAAALAILTFQQKGGSAWWQLDNQLHTMTIAGQDTLDRMAESAGIPIDVLHGASAIHAASEVFQDTNALARTLRPSNICPVAVPVFVNGRHVQAVLSPGAAPSGDEIGAVVQSEMVRAKDLVAKGVAREHLYDAIAKNGNRQTAGLDSCTPPDIKTVDAVIPSNRPSKGVPNARVTIQLFCPLFSKKQWLRDSLKNNIAAAKKAVADHPDSVRFVLRVLTPTGSDYLVSETAEEVLEQKGEAAFWRFVDLSIARVDEPTRADLELMVKSLGLNRSQWASHLQARAHKDTVDAELLAWRQLRLFGYPALLINQSVVSPVAQKMASYVEQALSPPSAGPN